MLEQLEAVLLAAPLPADDEAWAHKERAQQEEAEWGQTSTVVVSGIHVCMAPSGRVMAADWSV